MEEMPDAQVGNEIVFFKFNSSNQQMKIKGVVMGVFPDKFGKGKFTVSVPSILEPTEFRVHRVFKEAKVMKLK